MLLLRYILWPNFKAASHVPFKAISKFTATNDPRVADHKIGQCAIKKTCFTPYLFVLCIFMLIGI